MGTALKRNREVYQSRIPQPPKKRSIFSKKWNRKQTMNASFITPILCKRIVPGETLNLRLDAFVRLNTQLTCPIDNLFIETFFFYGPDRILWENHKEFMGEVKDPNGDKTERLIPQITIPAEKNTAGSLFNYLSASRIGKKVRVSKLPFELHNRIFNRFYRDPDCQSPVPIDPTDAEGNINNYNLYRIHKSRDMFTNSTRDSQQGEPVSLPFASSAPVKFDTNTNGYQAMRAFGVDSLGRKNPFVSIDMNSDNSTGLSAGIFTDTNNGTIRGMLADNGINAVTQAYPRDENLGTISKSQNLKIGNSQAYRVMLDPMDTLYADLSNSKSTLDALAQAIMTNEYMQALNRGGTKYTDIMSNIYDCVIPDMTIQEPVYLGGTHTPLFTNPVIQTSGSEITGSTTPQGNITGYGTAGDSGKVVTASFQEFGYVIGYMVIKAQPQYQQGLDSHWTERDFLELWNPFFNNAPDEPIYRENIFLEDYDATDPLDGSLLNKKVFGYIGRNDKMRYSKNEIAGELNSEYQYTLDTWHYAEKFENAPENNASFMEDKTYEILDRTLAVQWEDEEQTIHAPQFIVDIQFKGTNALPIPVHAVPKISSMLGV